jgi:hypothetical protein
MSGNNQPSVDGNDTWTAFRLVVLGAITLAVAAAVINFLAETGIGKF